MQINSQERGIYFLALGYLFARLSAPKGGGAGLVTVGYLLEVLGEEVGLHESSIGWSGSPVLPEER